MRSGSELSQFLRMFYLRLLFREKVHSYKIPFMKGGNKMEVLQLQNVCLIKSRVIQACYELLTAFICSYF